jgi:hypothetical protein
MSAVNYVNMQAAPEVVSQGDLIVVNGMLGTVDHSGPDAPGWVIEYSWRTGNGRIDRGYLWFDPDKADTNEVALIETRTGDPVKALGADR